MSFKTPSGYKTRDSINLPAHRCQACISKAVAWLIMSGRQKSRKRSRSEGNATTSVSSHFGPHCEDVPALFLPSQAWLPMKNNTNSIIQLLEPIKLRKHSWNGACTPPTAQLGARFFICYFENRQPCALNSNLLCFVSLYLNAVNLEGTYPAEATRSQNMTRQGRLSQRQSALWYIPKP